MSSSPSPEGAQKLLALLEKEEGLLVELEAARVEEAALNRAVIRRKSAETFLYATTKEIGALLDSMDCSSAGNWGFEGRMGWLLMEMRKLIIAKEAGKASL
jgi:hypothetical protein